VESRIIGHRIKDGVWIASCVCGTCWYSYRFMKYVSNGMSIKVHCNCWLDRLWAELRMRTISLRECDDFRRRWCGLEPRKTRRSRHGRGAGWRGKKSTNRRGVANSPIITTANRTAPFWTEAATGVGTTSAAIWITFTGSACSVITIHHSYNCY